MLTCPYIVSEKPKVTLGLVRYGRDFLGSGTLKPALSQLKEKPTNWADFLLAGRDVLIFG